ncbi:MAG: peptide deformylase [Rickettsiales bacterium]|jgi:peptide deformylase|nr:peptide deformylase [Rickettsiales bacterium]
MKNKTKVLQVGDPRLREKAIPVEIISHEIRATLDEMVAAMFASEGAGLAAPQLGLGLRMFVVRIAAGGEVLKIINPKLTGFSDDEITMEEGCLSVLGPDGPVYANVVRPSTIRLNWQDEDGNERDAVFDGIAARIIQHEFDHLEGVLFIDHVSALRRTMIMSKVKKAQQ